MLLTAAQEHHSPISGAPRALCVPNKFHEHFVFSSSVRIIFHCFAAVIFLMLFLYGDEHLHIRAHDEASRAARLGHIYDAIKRRCRGERQRTAGENE